MPSSAHQANAAPRAGFFFGKGGCRRCRAAARRAALLAASPAAPPCALATGNARRGAGGGAAPRSGQGWGAAARRPLVFCCLLVFFLELCGAGRRGKALSWGHPIERGSPHRAAASIRTPPPVASPGSPCGVMSDGGAPIPPGVPMDPPSKERAGPWGLPSPLRAAAGIGSHKSTWTPNLNPSPPPRKRVLNPSLLQREPQQGNAAAARHFPERPHCAKWGPAPGCCPGPNGSAGPHGCCQMGQGDVDICTS